MRALTLPDKGIMEVAEVKLSFYLDVIKRHWKAMSAAVLGAAALGLVYCVIAPKTYISTASLMPEEGEASAANPLSMITANLGFAAPTKGKNSALYMDVVKSRGFIDELRKEKYLTSKGDSLDLDSFYNVRKYEMPKRMAGLSLYLKHSLKVDRSENGIVDLTLETKDPVVSAELLKAILHHLEIYFKDLEAKKMEKSLEFMKEKMEEKEVQFRSASEQVTAFLSRNQYVDPLKTPHLFNELEGLKRDERIQEEIYLLLYKEYEKARIEKQKEKSTMQILDQPEPALEKEKPKRKKIMLQVVGGAFVLSYLLLMFRDRFRMKA